jgi:predicted aspartyl protease
MGVTHVDGTVTGPTGTQRVRFLVDSGAKYSVLPHDVWTAIGLRPKRQLTFILADGTHIERNISECLIEFELGDGTTPVVLGEGEDQALLGVITLEIFGFVLHPFSHTIQPARLLHA